MTPFRVLVVFGTRAEAIKLCVLIRRLQSHRGPLEVRTCVTAQHRSMLDQVLGTFEVRPDYDLNLMKPGQTLSETTANVLRALGPVLAKDRPALVLVQGDTTTAFAGALAAFYARIPCAHVEAGLRSGEKHSPFPEELNRRLISRLAELHFAATSEAGLNLRREGVAANTVTVTGNTIVDAMHFVQDVVRASGSRRSRWARLGRGYKVIVATAHRRESFGVGLERICSALSRLAARDDVRIVFPVHRNPAVRATVQRSLAGRPHIELCEPLEYGEFVELMAHSHLILTDSGGMQEEAPSLGRPLLVLRENTERPEGVQAGVARLVGTDPDAIVHHANRLLDDPAAYRRMVQAKNPYGDGRACERIIQVLTRRASRGHPGRATESECAAAGARSG